MRALRVLIDALRGALIGIAEIIPGVSGGTVALVVGIYDTLIDGAGNVVRGLVHLVVDPVRGRGTAEARRILGEVPWRVLIPLGIGMVMAVLVAARLLAPVVEDHPAQARAFFAGLVLVSIVVPARMVGGRWGLGEWLPAIGAAVIAFFLTGLPGATVDQPPPWAVAGAAATAICALVLPGVSGSFILVTMGLYEPTLDAVNDRDLAYVGTFALGAVIGLGAFVQVLRYLLQHRRRITLAIMTGLMVGSLRALWPWQTDDGVMEQPPADAGATIGLFVLGALVVLALLAVESFLVRRRMAWRDARES